MRDRILPQLFHRIILASRDYKRVSINNKACQLLLRQIAVQSVASSIKRLAFLERDALDYTYIRARFFELCTVNSGIITLVEFDE